MPIADPSLVLGGVVALQVLVALGALLAARPQRGVLLLALLTPFDGLLLLFRVPAVAEGYKEAILLLTLAAALFAPEAARATPRLAAPAWVSALLGFVLVCLGSALVVQGVQVLVGLKINLFYALLVPVLLRCPLSAQERDRLVSILMGVAVVTAAVGLAQQVVGAESLNALGYPYNDTIRFAGSALRSFSTFNQPFPFAFYLMTALLVGGPVALSDPRRPRNALFLLAVPLLAAAMLSSVVRAAIVGLTIGAAFLAVHRFRLLLHAVGPALAALLLVPSHFWSALLSSDSLGDRTTGWSQTVDRVVAAPFGNGIGATGSAAERAAVLSGTSAGSYQPDNYWFKTVFELGPLGLWMLSLLFAGAFLHAVRRSRELHQHGQELREQDQVPAARQAQQDAALAAGTAAATVAAAAASFFATYLEIFPVDLHFWLLLGVV